MHLYTVNSPQGGVRKEWYFHEHTLDGYILLAGILTLGLYDGRLDSTTHGVFELVTLSEPGGEFPNALRIPPGVWHSLRWETGHGMFVNAKTPPFNPDRVDKFRVSLDELPDAIDWNV